jgi:Tetrapyrrole (Corrin/Porphyrin) Methylases
MEAKSEMTEAEGAAAGGAPARPLGAIGIAWNVVVPEVDVHIVGYGNRLPNEFTLETLAVLKRCKRIFGLPPISAPAFGIPPMEDLLERFGDPRHAEIARFVVDAAADDPPVALATLGSPMVAGHAAHRIVEVASQRGLTFHVSNAVPPFDALWADLNIDPFFGFEIWAAATFVREAIEPDTRTHLLLADAPLLEAAPAGAAALRDHLLRFYAAEHDVHLIASQTGIGPHALGGGVRTRPLAALDDTGVSSPGSMLVPRVRHARMDFERPTAAGAADR